ncbi:MAG: response regulator [Desulfobacterales bacterium]|nr:response regulator [Desulfobacterales bacterium]
MSTILVIEDEKGLLQIIRQALTDCGYVVETAGDGLDGIRKFDEGSFDIVITDIRMPGIDGNGVVDHIRQSNRQSVPVIAITGTPWLLENKNFNMVLAKPFPLNLLFESVRSLSSLPHQAAVGM